MKVNYWWLTTFIVIAFVICIPSFGQVSTVVQTHEQLKVSSKILNEERTVLVRLPPNYANGKEKFPVVYMLDGRAPLINLMTGTIEHLVWSGLMPEMILVSIPNTDRARDMTPGVLAGQQTSGGAKNFLLFLQQELLPAVEKTYRVQPFRVIAGHSLSGLFVAYAFATKPGLFNAYLAASPGITPPWDSGFVKREAERFLPAKKEANCTVFFALGNEPQFTAGFVAFQQLLDSLRLKGLDYTFLQLPDENHWSTVSVVFQQGLRKVWEPWRKAANNESALYLNQKPPGVQAELFAPGIVSTNLYEHSSPAFSPDGKLVVWAVYSGNNYLLESKFQNGAWSKPAKPSFNDSLHGYVYPSFSSDGKILYFSSDRRVPAGFRQGNGNRIWQVNRTDTGWGEPVPFDTTASRSNDYAHALANNGTVYFSSGIRQGTNWNLRRSEKKNGRYTLPVLLPYPLNSRDYEDGAYIAPDESFLIFESQRPEGTNGNLSLFISFKNKKGQWSLPVNMGPKINSGKGERFARLSPDGRQLFFGSFRNQPPGSRGADIYWIDASVIDELRNTKEATSFIEQPLGDSILAALDRRDTEASAVFLKQWLQLHPGHLDATVLYSSMLRRQKRNAEAATLFTPFKEEWNTNNALVLEAALIQFGLSNEAAAKALLTPVLAQPMDLRQKYVHLADELFAMQLYPLSDAYFEQAQTMRPQAVALYNRACAYALIGKRKEAFALLNKAIDNGFQSRKDFEDDKDLQSLKGDPRWSDLEKRLK